MDFIERVALFLDAPEHALFKGRGGSPSDVALAQDVLGVTFDADYRRFVLMFGGSFVGMPIYGFNNSVLLECSTVVDLTTRFRTDGWPGAEECYVVSFDMSGNPIMIRPSGEVITFDHDLGQRLHLAASFREFVEAAL